MARAALDFTLYDAAISLRNLSCVHGLQVGILVAPYLVVGGTDSKLYAPLTDKIYRSGWVLLDFVALMAIRPHSVKTLQDAGRLVLSASVKSYTAET